MTPRESTRPDVPAHEVPAWSSPLEACRLILRGVTLRTAVKVAAVVGTILTIVNQGGTVALIDRRARPTGEVLDDRSYHGCEVIEGCRDA